MNAHQSPVQGIEFGVGPFRSTGMADHTPTPRRPNTDIHLCSALETCGAPGASSTGRGGKLAAEAGSRLSRDIETRRAERYSQAH